MFRVLKPFNILFLVFPGIVQNLIKRAVLSAPNGHSRFQGSTNLFYKEWISSDSLHRNEKVAGKVQISSRWVIAKILR